MKELSEESKIQLEKAMNEMENYNIILLNLESQKKDAEEAQKKAENERDKAINEVKTIRNRYINILSSDNN